MGEYVYELSLIIIPLMAHDFFELLKYFGIKVESMTQIHNLLKVGERLITEASSSCRLVIIIIIII